MSTARDAYRERQRRTVANAANRERIMAELRETQAPARRPDLSAELTAPKMPGWAHAPSCACARCLAAR